jgi:hypothetical protein
VMGMRYPEAGWLGGASRSFESPAKHLRPRGRLYDTLHHHRMRVPQAFMRNWVVSARVFPAREDMCSPPTTA